MIHDIIKFVVTHIILLLMFVTGLSTGFEAVRKTLVHRDYMLRAFILANLMVPLLALLVTRLPISVEARLAIVIMAICPGAPMIPLMARMRGGSEVSALALLLTQSLAAPFTVAFWSFFLSHVSSYDLGASFIQIARRVFPTILLPLALGWVVRAALPKAVPLLRKITNIGLVAGAVLATVGLTLQGGLTLVHGKATAWLALILLVSATAWLGHWLGGPTPEGRRALAVAAVLGNPALGMSLIATVLPDKAHLLPLVAAFIIGRGIALIPYSVWAKAHLRHEVSSSERPP